MGDERNLGILSFQTGQIYLIFCLSWFFSSLGRVRMKNVLVRLTSLNQAVKRLGIKKAKFCFLIDGADSPFPVDLLRWGNKHRANKFVWWIFQTISQGPHRVKRGGRFQWRFLRFTIYHVCTEEPLKARVFLRGCRVAPGISELYDTPGIMGSRRVHFLH